MTSGARSSPALSLPPRGVEPLGPPSAADAGATSGDGRGFLALDAILRRADAAGLVLVAGAPPVLDAVAAHAIRRARATGRAVLSVGRTPVDDALRELCAQISGSPPADPITAAENVARGLAGAVAVVVDRSPSTWGAAVLDALAATIPADAEGAPLVVVLAPPGSRPHAALHVRGALGPEESRAFWEAIALEADRTLSARFSRIDALEKWWSTARPSREGERPVLGHSAQRLLARIALSERAWHPGDLARLGSAGARDELLTAGAIEVGARGQAAILAPGWETWLDGRTAAPGEEEEDARAVAEVLERGVAPLHGEARHDGDAWAILRATELFARAGDADRAEATATRAILSAADADARADFWQRWQRAQALLSSEGAVSRLLRSAELALRVGDADRALDLARAAVSQEGNTYEATLLLGRAMAARGDLTTATLALTRAMDTAGDRAGRARAGIEIAEVHYVAGQIADARRLAEEAIRDAGDAATSLKARNVLGKLLLDNALWDEAEQHFAADAWEAACSGDTLAELRARLNRAIALMSSDRRDEARTMLTSVLGDGEAQGQLRAVCFALANLSIIALWKHEYGDALNLSERSIVFARRLGDKVLLAHLIANLSELRHFFGLIEEAEQALAFGRKACSAVVASKLASHFALVAARIHLARGHTADAHTEIKAALSTAESSPTGSHFALCHRVAARIALEDGDVARAAAALEKAKGGATNTKERSEAVLLDAMLAQAMGGAYEELAAEALALAGQSDNRMVGIEAHVLLCRALLERDPAAARSHLSMAGALRNRIAGALPEDARPRFFALRELAPLARLEAQIERGDLGAGPTTLRSSDGESDPSDAIAPARITLPPAPIDRRIVGRDPSMQALLVAVQKIGVSDATVLVHGESGTGKELIAEAIHSASQRRAGPLVKVNCAALVETLLLSELFGHEKGAFTGAVARRRGRFEMADGGTLFLDEIGDISPRTQVALLRVLQEKTFERVGGVTPIRANVRVVCATHRDLKAMVARGEFREDLYFRLTGVVLEVPALRQRVSDLPLIADAILARIAAERGTPPKRLGPAALQGLLRHRWPGNVRELENALRAASLFAEGDAIELEDLIANVDSLRSLDADALAAPDASPSPVPPAPRAAASASTPGPDTGTDPAQEDSEPGGSPLAPSRNAQSGGSDPTEVAYVHIRSGVSLHDLKRNIERECIQRALTESKGNITRAAALLGMKRPRLSQLVKQYGFGGVSEEDT
ncbi:MAG: sigma 54-interacting transcriptional regulator [Polyangiaceae bacterium]